MPLLEFCLAQGYELRFIELMRMGHLASDGNAFLQQFVSLQQLLTLIGERYEYLQADAPIDATAVRGYHPGPRLFWRDCQRECAVLPNVFAFASVIHGVVAWLSVVK